MSRHIAREPALQDMRTTIALLFAITGCLEVEDETSTLESAITVNGWTNDLQITGQDSRYQPGVVGFGGALYAIYKDVDSPRLVVTRFNGQAWNNTVWTNLQAELGPALAEFNNQLVTVYHSDGQNRLLMASSTDGVAWSAPQTVGAPLVVAGDEIRYAPAVGTLQGRALNSDRLFIAYCMRDFLGDKVRVDRLDGGTWTTVRTLTLSDSTCKSVALGSNGDGRLTMILTTEGPSTWRMYSGYVNTDGSVTVPALLSMKSTKPTSVVTCDGITHLVHSGGAQNPEQLWWTYRRADGTWAPDQVVPSQASHGGAGIGCLGTRAIMVHNGGYDQLWWSEYVAD